MVSCNLQVVALRVVACGCRPKNQGRSWEWAFPSVKHGRLFTQIVDGLHVISGRDLQLTNKSSMSGDAFKHKEKKLGVLCDVFLLLNNFFEQQLTLYKMYLRTSQRLLECFCCFSALLLVHKSKASLPKPLKCLTSNIVALQASQSVIPSSNSLGSCYSSM